MGYAVVAARTSGTPVRRRRRGRSVVGAGAAPPARSIVAITPSAHSASTGPGSAAVGVDDDHPAAHVDLVLGVDVERTHPVAAVEVGMQQDVAGIAEVETDDLVAGRRVRQHERPPAGDLFGRPVEVGTLDPAEHDRRRIPTPPGGERPLVERRRVVGRLRRRRDPVVEVDTVDPVVVDPLGEVGPRAFQQAAGRQRDTDRPVLGSTSVLDVDLFAVGVLDDDGAVRVGVVGADVGRVAVDDHRRRPFAHRPAGRQRDLATDAQGRFARPPARGTRLRSCRPSAPRPRRCRHSCVRLSRRRRAVPQPRRSNPLERTTATSAPSGTTRVGPAGTAVHGAASGWLVALVTMGIASAAASGSPAPITATWRRVSGSSRATPSDSCRSLRVRTWRRRGRPRRR